MLKFLKTILPQGLFGRSLIIVISPVILMQLVTAYVFIDRHFDKVTHLLANDIAGKIAGAVDFVMASSDLETEFPAIQNYIWNRYDLTVQPPSSQRQVLHAPQNFPYKGKIFYRALKNHLHYPFKMMPEDEDFVVEIATPKGLLIFKDQLKHLYPKTTIILLWWVIVTPVIFLFISIIFLKNQIKPLRWLSSMVDDFGRGQNVAFLKPTGSFEVRKVTHAFNIMKERIKRHMAQRTEMLAGISHDLKTPLTRMELQLAIMKPSPEVEQLQEDVKEMSRMIEEFLAFAKGEEGEERQNSNFTELMHAVVLKHDFRRIALSMPEQPIWFSYRRNAMTRCLSNIISNAMKYAKKLKITVFFDDNYCKACFDDDGPGIPLPYREEVFRPFFRLEGSRNSKTGGIGLGLAITRDIIHTHGGTIHLEDSSLGGLRVIVKLPI